MAPTLIVTIDTEEEGLWGGRYRPTGNTVENVQSVPRFQQLCDEFGIRPTYLVDAPVVQDKRAVEVLRKIQDEHRCEIGSHVHPWCNPPTDNGHVDGRVSYLCNLPEVHQRAKIEWLTDEIEAQFGHRPTSFRAGRYGLDIIGARILHQLGYTVDSSVIPFTDYSHEGGPDFRNAPCVPYFVNGDDLCDPHDDGLLLEVPVSVGFNRPDFERAHSLQQSANSRWTKPFHVEGVLDRLGIVRRIKFSPEQAGVSRLRQLVDACFARSAPCLVMMFHSSSLLPGASPYVRTEHDLRGFLLRLKKLFAYCLEQRGMSATTLTEYAATCETKSTSHEQHTVHASTSQ